MVAVGDVVDATVTAVRVFGVFCRHESQDMLVLIPETSWIASFNSCEQFATPGDTLTIKIKHIDHVSGKISATIKGHHSDPWQTDQLDVGKQYSARVVRYVETSDRCENQPAYLIELLPGAYTMLCANGISLQPDDRVSVTIQSSDSLNHGVAVTRSEPGR
ncbi:MAG: S1 RNA-binding domain-containing protein [Cyanobacteria bacterium P01_D01_bin.115]